MKRVRRWAPLILTTAVVVLLARFINFGATLDALDDMNALAILLTAGLYLLERFSMAFKWNILLRVRGRRLSQWAAFRIYMASGFVGYVMPSSVGSDVFRAARLSFSGRRASNASATIVLERVLGLLAILSLSFVGLVCLGLTGRHDVFPLLAGVAAALAVGSLLTAISMSERLYLWLKHATRRFAGNRIMKTLYALHDEYVALSRGLRPLIAFWLFSILNQLIQALMFVPVLLSLGARVELIALFALIPLNKMFIQFMPVPAAIGVAEGSVVVALSLANVPPEQGLAVALVLRAIDLSMLLPMGLAYAADCWLLRRGDGLGRQL
jgi:uncharacterized protein (TIRG00374 family)